MFSLTAGLLASMLHVLTGPDHLAAATPFALESERKAWKIGLLWGIGHLVGMMAIGVLFIIFKEFIPIESISNYSEQLVGLVLISIGLWHFIKYSRRRRVINIYTFILKNQFYFYVGNTGQFNI